MDNWVCFHNLSGGGFRIGFHDQESEGGFVVIQGVAGKDAGPLLSQGPHIFDMILHDRHVFGSRTVFPQVPAGGFVHESEMTLRRLASGDPAEGRGRPRPSGDHYQSDDPNQGGQRHYSVSHTGSSIF